VTFRINRSLRLLLFSVQVPHKNSVSNEGKPGSHDGKLALLLVKAMCGYSVLFSD